MNTPDTAPHRTRGSSHRGVAALTTAVLLALTSTSLPALASPPSPHASHLSARTQDSASEDLIDALEVAGAHVEVTGYLTEVADVPDGQPDTFISVGDVIVPIDPESVTGTASSGDKISTTIDVPGDVLSSLPAAEKATLALATDLTDAADGPVQATGDTGRVLLKALSDTATEAAATHTQVLESAAEVLDELSGPYHHTLQVVLMSRLGAGMYWSKTDLDEYVEGISQWWQRESRGMITSIDYDWNEVIAVNSDSYCSGYTAATQEVVNTALREAGLDVFDWFGNLEQRHLLVLTPQSEKTWGVCFPRSSNGIEYQGIGSVGTGFGSGGYMHIIGDPITHSSRPNNTVVHEFGHNFGYRHSGAAFCPAGKVDQPIPSPECTADAYANHFNVMGDSSEGVYYPINAMQKSDNGVIDKGVGYLELSGVVTGDEFVLTQASTPATTDLQGLKIIDHESPTQTRTYWIDYYTPSPNAYWNWESGISVTRRAGDVADPDTANLSFTSLQLPNAAGGNRLYRTGDAFVSQSGRLRVIVLDSGGPTARVRVELATSPPHVSLSQEEWVAPDGGGTRVVMVESHGLNWTASTADPWLSIDTSTGSDRLFSVVAAPLAAGSRQGSVTVRSASGIATMAVIQHVSDDCADSTTTTCVLGPLPGTAQGRLERDTDVDYWRFTPPTSGDWTLHADWAERLDIWGPEGELASDLYSRLYGTSRGVFLVAGTTYYVAVSQPSRREITEQMVPYRLTASPLSFELSQSQWSPSATGDSIALGLTGVRAEVPVSISADWIQRDYFSLSASVSEPGSWMRLHALPNSGPARTATVTFTLGSFTRVLTVTQAQGPALTLPQDSWSPGEAAAVREVPVVPHDAVWVATSSADWISVSPTAGTGVGRVAVTANPTTAPRTGTVTFTVGSATATLTVNQAAARPTVSLSRTTWDPPGTGGSGAVTVTTNTDGWRASSGATWVNLSQTSGASGASVTLTVTANPATTPRLALVTFTAGSASAKVTVTQAGGEPAVLLSPTSWLADATGGAMTTTVTTNTSAWQSLSDAAWLTVSPRSGASGAAATLTATANPTTGIRTGTVTFTAGPASATLTVTQAAGNPTVSLSRTTWASPATGGTVTATVTTNTNT
ncbi:MAG: hypothetical protein LBK72_02655, partial [Bifidobacteriaceae bacterium]|nr:hypothetical protein [Bifidobacteriaceae bacterium]